MANETPRDVARWMADEVKSKGYLYQEIAVKRILEQFGDAFVYLNENGNPAIDRKVLRAFRNLTEGTVVWATGSKCWEFVKGGSASSRAVEG